MKPEIPPEPHRIAETIDPQLVIPEIEQLGYAVLESKQPWRHGGFHLEKEGREYFLKMASTEAIGVRTTNEIAWNKAMALHEAPFDVPFVYEEGTIFDKVYYITDFIPGAPLLGNPEKEQADIETFASICTYIRKMAPFKLPRDTVFNAEEWLQKARDWTTNVAATDEGAALQPRLTALLEEKVAPVITTSYIPAMSHGDFVPGHIFAAPHTPILIDGEAGSALAPDFYDAAYCYHRLWTKSRRPDLAELFYSTFSAMLTEEDSEKIPLYTANLAYRLLGGFNDWSTKDGTDLRYHLELLEKLTA